MAKLTKAQRREIEGALRSVRAVIQFIESDRIEVCSAGKVNAEVRHYGTGESGLGHVYRAAESFETVHYEGRGDAEWSIDWIRTLEPISKGTGSDLVRLYTAQTTLSDFLAAHA